MKRGFRRRSRRFRRLEEWIVDGLKKGYSLGNLRDILKERGLDEDAEKVTTVFAESWDEKKEEPHKSYTGLLIFSAILFVFLSMFTFSFFNDDRLNLFTGKAILGLLDDSTALVNVNFSDHIGIIRNDFYGANTQSFLGIWLNIDSNGDRVSDSDSDTFWHREKWLESGMTYMRWDMNLGGYYSNSSNSKINFTGSLDDNIERLRWAHENNIRTLLVVDYMPPWLADVNGEGCNQTKLTDCMPYNMTLWQDIVIDYLDRLTVNGTYAEDIDIEVWNEPDIRFFLSNLNIDDQKKSNAYNILYNATYSAIKSKYLKINIGALGLASSSSENLLYGFLSNFSNKMQFVSFHKYNSPNDQNTYDNLFYTINKTLYSCSKFNANCSRIIISEFNVGHNEEDVLIKNDFSKRNEYGMNIGSFYASVLNNWPSNISMILYKWSENKKYSPDTNYSEYPQRWSMVSEPGLDNEYYPSYNVTKNFATYHSSGSMVVKSNSSLSNIRVVASKKDNQYITVINSGQNASVILNVIGVSSPKLEDLETGDVYDIVDGMVNIGQVNQYQIRYFVNSSKVIAPPPAPASSGSSSGGGGGVIIKRNTNSSKIKDSSSVSNPTDSSVKKEDSELSGRLEEEKNMSITSEEIGRSIGTGHVVASEENGFSWIKVLWFAFIIGDLVVIFVVVKRIKNVLGIRKIRDLLTKINNKIPSVSEELLVPWDEWKIAK